MTQNQFTKKSSKNIRKFINEDLKKIILKRKKTKALNNQNLNGSDNMTNILENDELMPSFNEIDYSMNSPNMNENDLEEFCVKEESIMYDNTLSVQKNSKNLTLGLYTIVEEDKSQLNKSRLSDMTKLDSTKNSKRKIFKFKNKAKRISDSTSNNLKKESNQNNILFNINIKKDFSTILNKQSDQDSEEEFDEINIYDPDSSSSQSTYKHKNMNSLDK